MVCLNDDSIGPAVRGCRDDFDFTIKFEQVFFSMIPAIVFAALSITRILFLSRQPKIVGGPVLQIVKLVCFHRAIPPQVAHHPNSLTMLIAGAFLLIRHAKPGHACPYHNATQRSNVSSRIVGCSQSPCVPVSCYSILRGACAVTAPVHHTQCLPIPNTRLGRSPSTYHMDYCSLHS